MPGPRVRSADHRARPREARPFTAACSRFKHGQAAGAREGPRPQSATHSHGQAGAHPPAAAGVAIVWFTVAGGPVFCLPCFRLELVYVADKLSMRWHARAVWIRLQIGLYHMTNV